MKRNLMLILILAFGILILTSCSSEKASNKNEIVDQEKDKNGADGKKDTDPADSGEKLDETNVKVEEKKGEELHLKAGMQIYIKDTFDVYPTAYDAKNGSGSQIKYKAGNYYVFKIFEGAVNVSRAQDQPGGWVIPEKIGFVLSDADKADKTNDNKTTETNKDPNGSTGEKITSTSGLSTKAYAWSWAYPDTSGANILNKYKGIYDLKGGNTIYLTFDNGYEYKNLTAKILDTLKANNVKAVFFTTSDYMRESTKLLKRMVNEGHIVGNHTKKHLNHTKSSLDQIYNDLKGWESDYVKLVGKSPSVKLFRPPEGAFNEISVKQAYDLGYRTVLWSYAYADWDTSKQPNEADALNKLIKNTKAGNVILLHAVSQTNANILDRYIKEMKSKGYNFGLLK